MSWLKSNGLNKLVIESDAKFTVESIRSSASPSSYDLIVEDCKHLLSFFNDVKLRFVHKSANSIAHLLARGSGSMSDLVEWDNQPPPFIIPLLISNIS